VQGLTNEELRLRAWRAQPLLARPGATRPPPGGESFLAVIDRVAGRHGPTHRSAPPAATSSPSPMGGSIRAALAVALGIEAERASPSPSTTAR